jgi:cold-inducible RNA-binding protein
MTNKLFIGNLEYSITEAQITELFATFGKVISVKIIVDRMTGMGKGFGFVEMETPEIAAAAMAKLNGSSFSGRAIVVNEAKPQERR